MRGGGTWCWAWHTTGLPSVAPFCQCCLLLVLRERVHLKEQLLCCFELLIDRRERQRLRLWIGQVHCQLMLSKDRWRQSCSNHLIREGALCLVSEEHRSNVGVQRERQEVALELLLSVALEAQASFGEAEGVREQLLVTLSLQQQHFQMHLTRLGSEEGYIISS